MKRLLGLLLAIGILTTAAGAAAYWWYDYSGRAQVKSVDGSLTAMVGARSDAHLLALMGGPITRVGNCFGLGDSLAIWPFGTEPLSGNRLKIGAKVYDLGDTVNLGGGVMDQSSNDFDPAEFDAPEGCPVTESIAILN